MSDRRSRILAKIFDRVEPDWSSMLHGYPCLVWQGPTSGPKREGDRNSRGHSYPRMNLEGYTVAVHRVMYCTVYGYVPSRVQIDHECSNRLCVQPAHLSRTSHKENQRRRDGKKPHVRSEYGVALPASLTTEIDALMKRFKCEEITI